MVEVDNLATLQDYYENDKSLNMEFVYRDEKLDQGCKFIVANTENRSIVVSDVGWTNFTLNKFVEMLNHFPMDIYNGYFFSHYDESFEWTWTRQSDPALFLITVFLLRAVNFLTPAVFKRLKPLVLRLLRKLREHHNLNLNKETFRDAPLAAFRKVFFI
ncbi:hypothetical protein ACFSQ7_34930 [Paenibacillus rhizoplanae]